MLKRVAIILNVNKAYDRKVVSGISRYIQGKWELYLEDDAISKVPDFNTWEGDGIIADLDDPRVCEIVKGLDIPVVGFGGGFADLNGVDLPYVYTDNTQIARLGAEHLMERGFRHFAFCSLPKTAINQWAQERLLEFKRITQKGDYDCSVFIGQNPSAKRWSEVQKNLRLWLRSLPKPVGLMAANDSRARHVLEAAAAEGLRVPDEIAVIGVDNDEMMCELANPPLSSVIQGTDQLGYEAAKILDALMQGKEPRSQNVIQPAGVVTRMSSDVLAIEDHLISRAVSYIRKNACNGIQVESVSRELGVSRSTLEKRFKKVLGYSVHAEIAKIQLKKAKDLLLTTDISLTKIATLCGYSSEQYLSLKVKQACHKTPLEFRLKKD